MLLAAFDRGVRGIEHGPGFLFPLLMLTLLGVLFVWFRRRRGGAAFSGAGMSPRQTLEDRFARGEIDREEFDHRRAVLDGDDVIPPAPSRPAPAAPPTADPGPVDDASGSDDPIDGDDDGIV